MTEDGVDTVGDVPLCLGCGLASHTMLHAGICSECFHRRERRAGGGPLRIITVHGRGYHETPLCPAVRGSEWRYIRDEDVMYQELRGRRDKCRRCHRHSRHGIDHYRGEEVPIGHA